MRERSYTKLEDFILTESFRNYVLGNSKEDLGIWSQWILDHPGQKEDFDKAVTVLSMLLHSRKQQPSVNKKMELNSLWKSVSRIENTKKIRSKIFSNPWLRIAAVFVVIVAFTIIWRYRVNPGSINSRSFYEIVVPIGEKSQVILPDGTHVWINSGSRFIYPSKYGDTNREVYLEGEAYFDVTKKGGMPFIVNTREVKVKVLGTAFNVKSYDSDRTVETTVVRGRVEVKSTKGDQKSILLSPNEKAVLIKGNFLKTLPTTVTPAKKVPEKESVSTPMAVMQTNPEIVTCWKDQLLVFTDETFEDMITKMERWYNIRIHLNDSSLRKERFNGKFVHNETVYQVLQAIRLTTPINYKLVNNEIEITRRKYTTGNSN